MAAAHEAHGGPHVELNFAASSTLGAQILSHGGAGVFASADPLTMERVRKAGLVEGEVQVLALSAMQIVVPAGNPGGVTGLAGLAAPGLKVVLAAPAVPAGRYATLILERAGVEVRPVSLEADVRGVLAKVALGEADAGIVYETDVAAAGSRVAGVAIPAGANVEVAYQIAVIRNSASGEPVSFAAFATGPEGRAILARHGFRLPAPPP